MPADKENGEHTSDEKQRAVNPERIIASRDQQEDSADGHRQADQDGMLSFNQRELLDHGAPEEQLNLVP
jgi:hypothetical protein